MFGRLYSQNYAVGIRRDTRAQKNPQGFQQNLKIPGPKINLWKNSMPYFWALEISENIKWYNTKSKVFKNMFGRLYSQNYAAGIRGHPKKSRNRKFKLEKILRSSPSGPVTWNPGSRGGGGFSLI